WPAARTTGTGGSVDTVGLIGLGNMGSGMAGNLMKAGFPLVVHDLRPEIVRDFAARGARAAASTAEVARLADVTLTSLPGPPEVEAAATGPGGVLDALRPRPRLVGTSTRRPAPRRRVRPPL